MSDSTGPVRRRRIAGETGPAGPAKKAVPVPKTAKRPATAKKAGKAEKAEKADRLKKADKARKVDQVEPAAKAEPAKTSPKAPAKAKTAKTAEQPQAVPTKTVPAKTVPTKAAPKRATPVSRPVAVPTTATRSSTVEAEDRPPGSRPSRRDLAWLVPGALLAVAALVLGVFFVVDPPGTSDGDVDTAGRQASSAAAGAAETIFSFRYDELDEHLKASKALMTPAFAKDFDKIAPALTELAPQRQIQVQAAVRDAAALPCGDECSADRADVLVFVDQARLVGGSSTPTVFANRIKVSMVKGDDGWRVSNIRAL